MFTVYKDARGEWRWRLESANNRIVADSSEGYANRADCLAGISIVKDCKTDLVYDSEHGEVVTVN
jgi:uncharacterized protein YegP (UPF0339 family)